MPKYAHYNPALAASPVYAWYDTDSGPFPGMPGPEYLIELTDEQWAARNSQPWQVEHGRLAPVPAVPLSTVRRAKLAELSAACQATIFSGFDSSALGAVHHYPATDRDQSNLAASVLASILPGNLPGWSTPFWCADSAGNWAFVQHTAAQIQAVGVDAKASIVAALERNAALAALVLACTDAASVAVISW